jgi:calcium-independent phospholipase A2
VKDTTGTWLDGGLVANNPTLDLLVDVRRCNAAARLLGQPHCAVRPGIVLSLGTGKMNPRMIDGTTDLEMPCSIIDAVFKAKKLFELKDLFVEQVEF